MDDESYIINNDTSNNEEVLVIKPQKRGVAVEPIMFTFFLAKTLSDAVVVNLLENRCCIISLGINATNCTEPLSKDVELLVQPIAVKFYLVKNIIEAVVPCILSLFIGPWSDINGRRPFLLLSLGGYTLSYGIWAGLSAIPNLPPAYFLFASLPSALTGGMVAIFISLLCMISDTSKPEQRGIRMGMFEVACLLGVMIALLSTSHLLSIADKYGFTVIFTTSFVLLLSTFIYTYLYVEESVDSSQIEVKTTKIFDLEYVKEIFKTTFKSRPNHGRSILFLIVLTMTIYLSLMNGEMSILYLSTRTRFQWELNQYTLYTSFSLGVMGLLTLGGIYVFTKLLRCPDMVIALLGTICRTLTAVIMALATKGWLLYVASITCGLGGLVGPLGRSTISKMVPNQDLGKIFAFTSFMEALCPLIATPLYTLVYNATLVTLPNAVFWMSAVLAATMMLSMGCVVFIQQRTPAERYSEMEGEDCEPNTSSINAL